MELQHFVIEPPTPIDSIQKESHNLVHAESSNPSISREPPVKAHCLPFSQIPHTTHLFTDFLAYSPQVQPFYPHSPHFSEWLKEEASALRYDSSRRESVTAILERQ